jgi:hypothetical protein
MQIASQRSVSCKSTNRTLHEGKLVHVWRKSVTEFHGIFTAKNDPNPMTALVLEAGCYRGTHNRKEITAVVVRNGNAECKVCRHVRWESASTASGKAIWLEKQYNKTR